jgi:hypothetical protein
MITSIEAMDMPGTKTTNDKSFEDEGFIIWNLANPEDPKRLGEFKTGGRGTHRDYYAGGRYVYATGPPKG